jgi:MFS family permease
MGIHYRWSSAPLLGLLALSIVMFVAFYFVEHRVSCPVLDPALFAARAYNFAVLAATMQSLAIFAVNFLVVFYLIGVRSFRPLSAALLLIPLPAFIMVSAPLSGKISDRIGARVPATLGLLIQCAALLWLTTLTYATPYLELSAALAFMGLGGGMFYAPNMSSAMNAAPAHRLGIASGTLFTMRQSGMVTSYAVSLAVAAASLPHDVMLQLFVGTNVRLGSEVTKEFVLGMHNAFYLSVALCFIAAILSFVRGKTPLAGGRTGI